MKNGNKGFTLIEIIIVVAIIGLLAVLGTLAVVRSVAGGRAKTAKSELHMLSTAVLQLAWDTGYMPNGQMRNDVKSQEVKDLSVASAGLADISDGADYEDEWKGPYYLESFVDPWGNNYFFDPDYLIDGTMRPVVGSYGPNRSRMNQYDADNIWIALDDLAPASSDD